MVAREDARLHRLGCEYLHQEQKFAVELRSNNVKTGGLFSFCVSQQRELHRLHCVSVYKEVFSPSARLAQADTFG
jgi:hypothetical protein